MKKLIILSAIYLIGFAGIAQEKKEPFIKRFNQIKSELNLSPEQELEIKKLNQKRKELKLNDHDGIVSEEEKKQRKLEMIKKRKVANREFRSGLAEILTDDQKLKLKELIPEKENKMKHGHDHDSKPNHEHKPGDNHNH